METLFQKLTTQLSEIFYNEPPKKLLLEVPPQWSHRKKTALAASATFSTLGASYMTYRYLTPKITIPVSSSTIGTTLQIVGSLAGLAGAAGLLAYISTHANQTKIIQTKMPKAHSDVKKNTNTENGKDRLSSRRKSQNNQDENHNNIKKFDILNYANENSSHSKLIKLFKEIQAEETIKKNLLEELITEYIDLSTTSPDLTITNASFFSDIILLVRDCQTDVFKYNATPDQKKSNFIKIIDILDVITGRTDSLSCNVVNNMFPDILPNGLNKMNALFNELLPPSEYNKLVDRVCQLTYKSLNQQLKILFSDSIKFKIDSTDEVISRILELLTPFKNDAFRHSPNFYANFMQHSPKLAWRFVNKYIFEHVINDELLSDIDLSPDVIIARFLNARDDKCDKNDDYSLYNYEHGSNILTKIIEGAKRSLFLDDREHEAAAFAIRLMQQELLIDPKEFEKNYLNDFLILKQLYFDLCIPQDLNFLKNFSIENVLSKPATEIALRLINEHKMNFEENHNTSDETKFRHLFLKQIIPLNKNSHSVEEKTIINKLSTYIANQITNPHFLKPVKLVTLVLNRYPKVFQNEESINLIREAYQKVKGIKNRDLYFACLKFLKNCEASRDIPPENIGSQTNLTENLNSKKTFKKGNITNSDIQRLLKDFHTGEKINKSLLEKLISTYIDLSTTSPKATIPNETFLSAITKIIKDYKKVFYACEDNLVLEKSNLNKIIDILDVFTGRVDPLSCQLVANLINIFSFDLHQMTQFIVLQDTKSNELVESSCQLIYKALTQQMKILFKDGTNLSTNDTADQTFSRIFKLLTPLDKKDFRQSPNFYTNFIQSSPKHAWQLIGDYILEYLINSKLPINIDLPEQIANFLNEEDHYCNRKNKSPSTSKEGLDVLKKIVSDAQLSLFLEGVDHGAASFAIRLIQYKLKIKPEAFEQKYPNDCKRLQQLYLDLCTSEDSNHIKNFAKVNGLSDDGIKIANILISKCMTTRFVNNFLGTDITNTPQRFIDIMDHLFSREEYSETDREFLKALTFFIVFQISDPSILQRADLASLALILYPEVFLNVKSAKIIQKAYQKVKFVENTALDTACMHFFGMWDALQESKPEIKQEPKNSECLIS